MTNTVHVKELVKGRYLIKPFFLELVVTMVFYICFQAQMPEGDPQQPRQLGPMPMMNPMMMAGMMRRGAGMAGPGIYPPFQFPQQPMVMMPGPHQVSGETPT